jgi:hypothetical protein
VLKVRNAPSVLGPVALESKPRRLMADRSRPKVSKSPRRTGVPTLVQELRAVEAKYFFSEKSMP